jgi:glycerophosphoryl diester phosphodiesterase
MLRLLAALMFLVACSPQEAPPRLPPVEGGWAIDPGSDLNAFFDCLAGNGAAIVAAHRGGPARGYPENALETFARTLREAPALLEVDVAESKDGVLFLLHDETLDRTTTGRGEAAQADWASISKLKLKDDGGASTRFAPPRLDDVLVWAAGRTVVKLDLKPSVSYEALAETVDAQGAQKRVVLIAYTLGQAKKLHRLLPQTMISLNLGSMSELNAAVAAGIPADRLIAFAGADEPDPRLFQILQQRAVEADFGTLGPHGVDAGIARSGDEALYGEIAAMGADILSTDRPREAYGALAAAGRAPQAGRCGVTNS